MHSTSSHETQNHQVIRRWLTLVLTVWAFVAFMAAINNWTHLVPLRLLPLLVATGITAPVLAYYLLSDFRSFVRSIHPRHLVIFHLWRIPAGLAFLYYGEQHWLPAAFVRNAGYGDIFVGLLVPLILVLRENRWKYLMFQTIGLADFILAVGTGLTFSIMEVPLMQNILDYPIILIPLFGVCVTGAFHIMAIDALLWSQLSTVKQTVPPTIQ
jgi:hypothetical protein